MEPTENEILTSLTDEQIERIAGIVLDEFGPMLTRSVFNDIVLAMFENIAGLDLVTQKRTLSHVREMWVVYRRLVRSNRTH